MGSTTDILQEHAQGREDDQQAAQRERLQAEALQLLKHAVYLYKAKLAPPVLDAGGRPVDFGDLLVR